MEDYKKYYLLFPVLILMAVKCSTKFTYIFFWTLNLLYFALKVQFLGGVLYFIAAILNQVLPQQDFRIIHGTTQFKECFYARENIIIFNKWHLIILVY